MEKITYATIIFIWLDVIFTAIFIHYFGIEIEANPIGRYLFEHPISLILTKIGSSILIYLIYWFSNRLVLAKFGLIEIFTVYSLLILYHIVISIRILIILKSV